jgi:hypothetical protein
VRLKATLGQTALQRHLTAFETHFVIAACTGFLTFVTTTSGFAEARANATAHAPFGVLRTLAGFDGIEFHGIP